MNKARIQWLTSDESLFELDWLKFLFSDVQDYIDVEYDWRKIKTDENTVLICNHAVPYRYVLENLRQRGKKYVIVLLSDENLREPCEWLHDPACLGLLRNYVHPAHLGHPKVTVFGLGYKRGFRDYLKENKNERPYQWCFAGTPHGERARMLELFNEIKPHKTHLCSGFNAADGLSTEKYVNMLQNSVFALCPEGQDSMDSFRLYEALEAGCIPITKTHSNQFVIKPSYWHAVFQQEIDEVFIYGDSYKEIVGKIKENNEIQVQRIRQNSLKMWATQKQIWKLLFNTLYNRLK